MAGYQKDRNIGAVNKMNGKRLKRVPKSIDFPSRVMDYKLSHKEEGKNKKMVRWECDSLESIKTVY